MPIVPYVSQIDSAPRSNDCGPACVAMMAGALHPDAATAQTVTELSTQYDRPQDGTTPRDIVTMAAALGVELEVTQARRYPCVPLVDYRLLPVRYQAGGDFGHWIVRLSDTAYHDPLGRGAWGANRSATKEQLDAAEMAARRWISSVPVPVRVAFKTDINEDMATTPQTKGKARIKSGPWRVRSQANNTSASVTGATLATGQEFDVLSVVTGAGYQWGVVSMSAGGAPLKTATGAAEFVGYVRGDGWSWVTTAPPPVDPPIVTSKPVVGVSVLNRHDLLEPAYAAGVRSFLVMDGVQAARDFKARHPDAIVMYRRFMPHGRYLPDVNNGEMRELQTIGSGIILVSPANEQDIWPYDSPDTILARAKFDVAMATECRKHGTLYAGGGFSMGTPDYTKPEICEAMRVGYAPHYNSGLMGINYHSYSPNPQSIDRPQDHIWYETRWRFLFDRCGFINTANPVGIVSDETGLDQGGIGGVPAHGLGGAWVRDWTRKFIASSSQPVQGKRSPMRAATWFQAGRDSGQWAGYNIASHFGAITEGNQ